jgi:hypothetical protein
LSDRTEGSNVKDDEFLVTNSEAQCAVGVRDEVQTDHIPPDGKGFLAISDSEVYGTNCICAG